MGTFASKHWDDTSGDNSALPTSQKFPVIPTTALMMTHIRNNSKKYPFFCFLCFILSFWHISRFFCFSCLISSFWHISRNKYFRWLLPWFKPSPTNLSLPYLHGWHRTTWPHKPPVSSPCPSTTAQSLPPQPMSMPFRWKDGWQKTVPLNVSSRGKSAKLSAMKTNTSRTNKCYARELFSLQSLPPQLRVVCFL